MIRGRSLVLAVVLVGATFGCSSGDSDGSDGAGPPAEVTRVVATGVVPVHDQVQLMDAAIVGVRMGDFGDDEDEVVVSLDDGRSWRAVSLPDRPAELALSYPPHGLYVDRDLVVVAGRDEASAVPGYPVSQAEFRLWTSPDGVTWAGHVLETAGGTVGEPTVAEVGSVLVAAIGSVEGLNLYTSGDRGATWQRAEVTGLPHADDVTIEAAPTEEGGPLRLVDGAASPAEGHVLTSEDDGATWRVEPCEETCHRPSDDDETIRRRPDPSADDDDLWPGSEYSLDDGETWHQLSFEPPPPGHTEGRPSLSSAVKVPGGWLATATSSVDADSSGTYYGHLLHSDDGRSWTQLLPVDACPSTDGRRVGESSVTRPVRFEGRWYVAFSCRSRTPFAAIYSGDAEAEVFRPLEGTRREGAAFDEPIHDGARLLFPEEDADRALVGFTALA